ncbi:hypothetical protein Pcaca05_09460 [Pectobacterium carotovorum subsp. carotovorum]|nr:hypothetical protein Pcaca05_09460 [Pectobacterium carotovorum subsp. carotovorum]
MVDTAKMKEAINNTLETAKALTTEPVMKMVNQRLSNPFFLYFISSWIICNWDRVILLIFAFNLSVETRIEKIKLLPSNSVFFGFSIPHTHTIWYPFIATVFFVVGAPFISYCVDLIHNSVINKKNLNDSNRMQSDLDLKMAEIGKKVLYDYKDEQERLKARKASKEIEFDIIMLEERYSYLTSEIKTMEDVFESKKQEVDRQSEAYNQTLVSIYKLRGELDAKDKELKSVNGKIIEQQKLLDDIKKEISSNKLPGNIFSSNPFASAVSNPFADGVSNPFADGVSNPFADSVYNPFADGVSNPFVDGVSNPFAVASANPFVSTDPEADNVLSNGRSKITEGSFVASIDNKKVIKLNGDGISNVYPDSEK